LPYFEKGDPMAYACDYVESAFLQGLTPNESFMHAIAGRIGLIDTAVKTSDTGYTERRLVKIMEDMTTSYDGTVRNAWGFVFQFAYGGNAMDPSALLSLPFRLYEMTPSDIAKTYHFTPSIFDDHLADFVQFDIISNMDIHMDRLQQHWRDLEYYSTLVATPKVQMPFDMRSIVKDAWARYPNCLQEMVCYMGIVRKKPSDLPLDMILDGFLELRKFFETNSWCDIEIAKNHIMMMRVYIESELSPRLAWCEKRLDRRRWDYVITSIKNAYLEALATPGESFGVVAAQSIGEPCTQMTLNSTFF